MPQLVSISPPAAAPTARPQVILEMRVMPQLVRAAVSGVVETMVYALNYHDMALPPVEASTRPCLMVPAVLLALLPVEASTRPCLMAPAVLLALLPVEVSSRAISMVAPAVLQELDKVQHWPTSRRIIHADHLMMILFLLNRSLIYGRSKYCFFSVDNPPPPCGNGNCQWAYKAHPDQGFGDFVWLEKYCECDFGRSKFCRASYDCCGNKGSGSDTTIDLDKPLPK